MKRKKSKYERFFDFADEEENEFYDCETYKNGNVTINKTIVKKNKNTIKKGKYYSIEFLSIEEDEPIIHDELVKALNSYLDKYKDIKRILVVGIGNDMYSPDSLGPSVCKNIEATFFQNIKKNNPYKVGCFIPGVKGTTGLESAKSIKAIVEKFNFELVICIDSLATSSLKRLNKAIQITDNGITPGSGVDNYRKSITKNYLKVPVIALGVATVISYVNIIYEAINDDILFKKVMDEINEYLYVFTVKEIESKISKLTYILSNAINDVLH